MNCTTSGFDFINLATIFNFLILNIDYLHFNNTKPYVNSVKKLTNFKMRLKHRNFDMLPMAMYLSSKLTLKSNQLRISDAFDKIMCLSMKHCSFYVQYSLSRGSIAIT